jgi:hypothetical protein
VHDPATASTATALDLVACLACAQVAEVTGSFTMPGLDGAERYVRTRCMGGHVMVGPEFALR